jgi:hypothetical protein
MNYDFVGCNDLRKESYVYLPYSGDEGIGTY